MYVMGTKEFQLLIWYIDYRRNINIIWTSGPWVVKPQNC